MTMMTPLALLSLSLSLSHAGPAAPMKAAVPVKLPAMRTGFSPVATEAALKTGPGLSAGLGLEPALTLAPIGQTPLVALSDPRVRAMPAPSPTFGDITGALTRPAPDPGPIRKMWFIFADEAQRLRSQDSLERVREENPGVEAVSYGAESVLTYKTVEGKREIDTDPEVLAALSERIAAEGAELVLTSDQELYEVFRMLRDRGLSRDVPFGFVGRRSVSVDIPRASLDPSKLSDPTRYPHRKYLEILEKPSQAAASEIAGMKGERTALGELLDAAGESGHGPSKSDEDMGFFARLGTKALLRLAGAADDRVSAKLREEAHALAGALERGAVDVLVTDDPRAAEVVGLMKRMGYHKSLPVVWKGRAAPGDASGINLALRPGGWLDAAPHVRLAKSSSEGRAASLKDAVAQAPAVERLPENFMEMGGVSARGFEPAVAEAVARAAPDSPAYKGRYDVHFLLTNGNGVRTPGDANAFGHFGMAVKDEKGKTLVWTVQYNDGGSFTGGLGDVKQMTLAEYLYSLWYLPGAAGQAIPLAETAVSPVVDFVLKGAVDQAGLEAMRRVAAYINAKHLRGEDRYSFLNAAGMTNCISLVTQILRAAGFPIAESGVQAPADKAVELISLLARGLLNNRVGPTDFGLVVFERPAHAGPEHYRIANTALGSPLFNRRKPWQAMSLWEKARRILASIPNFIRSLAIPKKLDAFSAMASHRVRVGPNSRELRIEENPDSPIVLLRRAAEEVERLRRERVPVEKELASLNEDILRQGGYEDWRPGSGSPRPSPEQEAVLKGLRERHRGLELELALSILDEQVSLRKTDYLKLVVADLPGRHTGRLERVRRAQARVIEARDLMETDARILTETEIASLNALNAEVENELQKARLAILKDVGPDVPHDMGMISRQVTLGHLDELLHKSRDGSEGGSKAKDKKL